LLTYLGFRISQKRATRPFYSAKIVFTIGLGGVSIASALAVFISISINSGGGTFVCEKDMQSQIYKAISATVPIGTNLGAGTGFYVSKDGTIITADHVVDGADLWAVIAAAVRAVAALKWSALPRAGSMTWASGARGISKAQ
jgi:S1-C subfamily serine protease